MSTIELAQRLVAAIEAGDEDAVRGIYHPDAVIWHNNDQVEQSVEENLRVLRWLIRKLSERHYEIVRREALPDGFLQQHVLHGVAGDGTRIAMPACLVVRTEGDRIVRLDEYLDPGAAAALAR